MNVSTRTSNRFVSYPYEVESPGQLPASLVELASQNLPAGEEAGYIFVMPANVYSHGLEPEQALIFCKQGVLHVQAADRTRRPGRAVFVRLDRITHVHLTLVLLYGCLEFYGANEDGPQKIRFEYNAVRHEQFWPHLADFLLQVTESSQTYSIKPSQTEKAWEAIHGADFKYINGFNFYAHLPGEHLAGAIFQPEVRRPLIAGLSRQVIPPSLLVLTDRQVVLVGEPGKNKKQKDGWIFDFFPRQFIKKFELQPQREYDRLSIQLTQSCEEELPEMAFSDPLARRWMSLWERDDF